MQTNSSRVGRILDLTNCDKEPIHIPGSVQPHGVLIVLDEPTLSILRISDNCRSLLGHDPAFFLGKPIEKIIHPSQCKMLSEKLMEPEVIRHNPHQIQIAVGNDLREFDGIAHRHNNELILELELSRERAGVEFKSFYHEARHSVQRLRSSKGLEELYSAAVSEVRRVTGFDRVIIYKFDDEWNGEVLAEERRIGTDSYLNLHFPASDIPRQARELYYLNRLRIIPTVSFSPSAIVPAATGRSGSPLDLSLSTLRSVSPIHLEYLRNMRVTASMSISIMKSNRLWGLISCTHESGALYVPYDMRAICDFLGETLSSLLPIHEIEEDSAYRVKLATIQGSLLHSMNYANNFIDGLLKNSDSYLKLTNASGGAIWYDGKLHIMGQVPNEHQINEIIEWVLDNKFDDIFATSSLSAEIPSAQKYKDTACGIMGFSISKAQANCFLWFRPEVIQTVNWGGNPNKLIESQGDSTSLHPRKSFELWKETVRLKALPWKEEEKQAAANLRTSIIDIVLQRVEKIAKLNVELERSNNELDSFAYAASHDLKEPLRGIHNYVGVILRDEGDRLTDENRSRMETVLRLTQRSEDLINSLLYYSQIGRTNLSIRSTDLNSVVHDALEAIKSRIEEEKVQIKIPEKLPTLVCDRIQMTEVFTNLLSNAIKYNNSPNKTVEIGTLPPQNDGMSPIIFVRDNGIGIDPIHHNAIFRIFKRLHAKERFGGGTGTGLTIAHKVIERHGGQLWVESSPGEGSTFLFTIAEVKSHAK